jgi:hypothetical protein
VIKKVVGVFVRFFRAPSPNMGVVVDKGVRLLLAGMLRMGEQE